MKTTKTNVENQTEQSTEEIRAGAFSVEELTLLKVITR